MYTERRGQSRIHRDLIWQISFMEHHCRFQLVTSIELVFLQPRLTCEALPAESRYIVDTDPREGEDGTYH